MESGKSPDAHAFTIGAFKVEQARNLLIKADERYTLEPRIMDVLCALAEDPGNVISRDALIDRIWHVEVGADESLTRAISILRKTFREAGERADYIETIPKRGYRLRQPVSKLSDVPSVPTPEVEEETTAETVPPVPPNALARTGNSAIKQTGTYWIGGLAVLAAIAVVAFWPRSDSQRQIEVSTIVEAPERSVAVLPFVSINGSVEDKYFADGLSEELLNTLAAIKDLKVPGRIATFAFRDNASEFQEIGRVLGVAHVLEGSIRRTGNRVRITAQLTSVDDGYQLWSETYDRELDDLFAVEDDIARRVANALNSRLVNEGEEPLFDVGTQNATAFQHYVEGRQHLNRRGLWLARAITSFETAIENDPDYARAYSGLATAHVVSHIYLNVPKEIARKRAQTFANIAASLDPSLSEPLAVLGVIEADQTHWQEAVEFYREGEQRNPDDVVILQWHGELLANLGYLEEAQVRLDRAMTLDPGSAIVTLVAANIAWCLGNLETAEKLYLRADDLGMSDAVNGAALIEFQRGHFERSANMRAQVALNAQLISEDDLEPLATFYVAIMRREVLVDEAAAVFPALARDDDFLMPAYLFSGEHEKALKILEIDPDGDMDSFFMLWSDLDPDLRRGPDFEALVRNTGLLDYWRINGFPDKCRPLGPTEFECD